MLVQSLQINQEMENFPVKNEPFDVDSSWDTIHTSIEVIGLIKMMSRHVGYVWNPESTIAMFGTQNIIGKGKKKSEKIHFLTFGFVVDNIKEN